MSDETKRRARWVLLLFLLAGPAVAFAGWVATTCSTSVPGRTPGGLSPGAGRDSAGASDSACAGGSGGAGGIDLGQGGAGNSGPGAMCVSGPPEWFIGDWGGIRIYKEQVKWATAYARGDNIWNPQLLAVLKGFGVFRHMETNAVNWSKIRSWSQRKRPTDSRNASIYMDGASGPSTTGIAIEWQIDLCNRANLDCWFTHPYLADDNYLRQQAMLIKGKLKPNLRVYIELSNEVWNGSYSAFNQSIAAGVAGGLPGSSKVHKGIAHELYRALQMYQIYEKVFGSAEMRTRVVRVFAESVNLELTAQALTNVYTSTRWNPNGQKVDMIVGNDVHDAHEVLANWNSAVSGEPSMFAVTRNTSYDITQLGCYEPGMDHPEAVVWAANPIVYKAYIYMIDSLAIVPVRPCCLPQDTWAYGGAGGRSL